MSRVSGSSEGDSSPIAQNPLAPPLRALAALPQGCLMEQAKFAEAEDFLRTATSASHFQRVPGSTREYFRVPLVPGSTTREYPDAEDLLHTATSLPTLPPAPPLHNVPRVPASTAEDPR